MKTKEFKKMKDRDMNGITVYFDLIQSRYYFKKIVQPSDKITETYLANLAGTTVTREWCDKSMGGWNCYLPNLNQEQFSKLEQEVKRLGGNVIISQPR